jgi:hypothetical protein
MVIAFFTIHSKKNYIYLLIFFFGGGKATSTQKCGLSEKTK